MPRKAKMEETIINNSEFLNVNEPEQVTKITSDVNKLVNCLRNERIIVRHLNRQTGIVRDPRHVLYGGMSENAKKVYTVPLLRSGALTDVLTKDEKDYLEYALGLEPNALSVYKKENNFWDTTNDQGISKVILYKHDNYLDLSNPVDYIKYKILLANKDRICASAMELQDRPKATYEYVLLSDNEESVAVRANISTKMQCYKEFGKIESNADLLRLIIETIDGRVLDVNTKIEILQTKINDIIQNNSRLFLSVVKDPLLPIKVLINKALNVGIIVKRGDYLYLRSDNSPLCENNQEPTLNIAAAYLSNPRRQELKFSIEAKVKEYDSK
ncbi:MAG: hypothetical protein IJU02_07130 [Lachnospiraceae bacterium]|nr:hypothetical protein [Lachnospiraceae bacterium]